MFSLSLLQPKLSKQDIKWLLEAWKVFSRAVYIGLHSDENYFCVRILGEAILLKPKLEILHTLEKEKEGKRLRQSPLPRQFCCYVN